MRPLSHACDTSRNARNAPRWQRSSVSRLPQHVQQRWTMPLSNSAFGRHWPTSAVAMRLTYSASGTCWPTNVAAERPTTCPRTSRSSRVVALQRSGATTRRLNWLPCRRNERSQRSAAATMRPHGPPHQRSLRSQKSVGQPSQRYEHSRRSVAATMRPHGPPHQRNSRSRKCVGQPSQRYERSRRSVAAMMRPHGPPLWQNSLSWRRVAATILRPRLLSQPRWRWLKSDVTMRQSPKLPRWRKRRSPLTAFAFNRQRIGRSSMRAVTIRQWCVQWHHPHRPTAFRRQFSAFRQHAIPSLLL